MCTAATLPLHVEIPGQLAEGRPDGEARLTIPELEVLKDHYVFGIVTTHDYDHTIRVLDLLGTAPYCPASLIVECPMGKRQSVE